MDQQEFYLNLPKNHECFKLPGQDRIYLLKGNFLSEFFTEDEKAEARFNLGISPLLNELKAMISAKLVDDSGNLKFGLEPTNGEENLEAYSEVLSSAVIYNTLLKYYTKSELDGWILNLEERIAVLKSLLEVTIDEDLDENSTNPVLNKAIVNALKELNTSYNRLSSSKIDREELLNYYNIDEIVALLNLLELTLVSYADTKDVDLSIYFTKEEINSLLSRDYATKEFALQIELAAGAAERHISETNQSLRELSGLVTQIDLKILGLDEDIQNVLNLSGNVDSINRTVSEMEQTVNTLSETVGGISETVNQTVNLSLGEINLNIESMQEDVEDIKEDINELKDTPKHVFLTLDQYEALLAYDNNTLYFIIESSSEGSQFGDTFPLTFG